MSHQPIKNKATIRCENTLSSIRESAPYSLLPEKQFSLTETGFFGDQEAHDELRESCYFHQKESNEFYQQRSCFVAASRASDPYRLYVAVFQTPLAGCLLGGDRRQKFLRVGNFVWESSPVKSIYKVLLTSQIVTVHQGRRINNDQ